MKKTLNISFTMLLFAGLVTLLVLTSAKHEELPCSEIFITINETGANDLLSSAEIEAMLPEGTGAITGKPCSEICIETIAAKVASNPWVKDCDICLTVNGVLRVDVKQRKPLARVYNEYGDPYLLDDHGNIIPPKGVPLDLPVISGYIGNRFRFNDRVFHPVDTVADPLLSGLYHLVLAIGEDPFLAALIDQVYVNREGEIEMIPKVGRQVILFGSFDRMEQKLLDLRDTYMSVLPSKGWDVYTTINLKYENQIICSK